MLDVSNTVAAAGLLFLFQSATGPPLHSGERHVTLTNHTREPIVEMYVSDDDRTDSWQEDVLGVDSLSPGKSVYVDTDKDKNGNCLVDVKAILDSGANRIFRSINSCYDGHAISVR
jgi:hypothetical protein